MQLTITIPDELADEALSALARATGVTLADGSSLSERVSAVEVGMTAFAATLVTEQLTRQRVNEEARIARSETAAVVSAAFGTELLDLSRVDSAPSRRNR